MMTCGCGCGRTMRSLNPRRQYHPECNGQPVTRLRRVYTGTSRPENAVWIEARYQAARAARKRAA